MREVQRLRVGLHDGDAGVTRGKKFPNLALMKIAAYHRALGDEVVWWEPIEPCDKVYSSKVFDFTPDDPYLPADAVRGGTGYRDVPLNQELPDGIDRAYPDYSIYPGCGCAIGYLTRGCPNNCRWCVVPKKEGSIRPYRDWREVVRQDSDNLVLMDNNILAIDYGIEQLQSMIGSRYRIDLNQGMDARLVTPEVSEVLARLDWIRFIRFSCDQKSQIEPVMRAVERLGRYGVRPYRVFVYLLVTADIADAAYRVDCLRHLNGINLYAQAERNPRLGIMPNAEQLEFAQRYVYGGSWRQQTWGEYCRRCGLER